LYFTSPGISGGSVLQIWYLLGLLFIYSIEEEEKMADKTITINVNGKDLDRDAIIAKIGTRMEIPFNHRVQSFKTSVAGKEVTVYDIEIGVDVEEKKAAANLEAAQTANKKAKEAHIAAVKAYDTAMENLEFAEKVVESYRPSKDDAMAEAGAVKESAKA
jgi:hypothetical protein